MCYSILWFLIERSFGPFIERHTSVSSLFVGNGGNQNERSASDCRTTKTGFLFCTCSGCMVIHGIISFDRMFPSQQLWYMPRIVPFVSIGLVSYRNTVVQSRLVRHLSTSVHPAINVPWSMVPRPYVWHCNNHSPKLIHRLGLERNITTDVVVFWWHFVSMGTTYNWQIVRNAYPIRDHSSI